jgi:eukaryotic-like serine/threonine-protein kinase
MAGGDLTDAIERARGRLPLAYVLELGTGISRGLAAAHELGLVHRDLKPGNVWLTNDGQPKIGDWGLALPLDRTRCAPHGGDRTG